ncbi:MAG: MASE1 domain-containing protein [Planctomycetes bacterium]|nr:MASE1 domain-containing protein [Planctomycetota bacterium]
MSMRRLLSTNALVALAWGVGAASATGLAGNGQFVLLWPPSGIALGALLVGGMRMLPGVVAGASIAALLYDLPPAAAAVMVVGSTGASVLGAWLLRRVVPLGDELRRTRDVLRLVVFGAVVASVVPALCATFALGPLARAPAPPDIDVFFTWWMADVVGVLLFTPLVLAWASRDPPAPVRRLRGARYALLAGLATLAFLGAAYPGALPESTIQLLALPLLVSTALISDLRLSYSATIVLVFAVVAGHAPAPGSPSLVLHATELWIFSTSASLSVLVSATLAASEPAARIEAQAQQRLRQLMDATPSAIWVGDIDGRCTFVNRTYCEYLGIDGQATREFGYLDYVHPDDRPLLADLPARVQASPDPVVFEARKRAADGSWRWFAITSKRLVAPDGRHEGIVATCIDIDDRHVAEADLRRHTEQLQPVNEALSRVLERNDWEGAAGLLLDALLAQTGSARGFVAEQVPAGLDVVACCDGECHPTRIARRDLPAPLVGALTDGRVVATRGPSPERDGPLVDLGPVLVLPLVAEDGIVGLFVAAGREEGYDVREADDVRLLAAAASVVVQHKQQERRQRQLEQQLVHRERLASIGTLAAGVAHEINNPVGAILLSVQAAQRAFEDEPAKALACIERIEQDARRCARITRGILRFARQERGDRQARDLVPTIHAAIDFVRSFAERSRCALVSALPDSLPDVVSNGHELEQVLVNLVQNAIQAAARRVDITAGADAESISIVVVDDGEGLDPEAGDRIFDPFFTTRQDEGGTGLGLSLSHGIVTDHGGALAVSAREGGGTRAVIVLPRADVRSVPLDRPPVGSSEAP